MEQLVLWTRVSCPMWLPHLQTKAIIVNSCYYYRYCITTAMLYSINISNFCYIASHQCNTITKLASNIDKLDRRCHMVKPTAVFETNDGQNHLQISWHIKAHTKGRRLAGDSIKCTFFNKNCYMLLNKFRWSWFPRVQLKIYQLWLFSDAYMSYSAYSVRSLWSFANADH